MKTADRFLVGEVQPPFSRRRHPTIYAAWQENLEATRRLLAAGPRIFADNVANLVHGGAQREYRVEDFPSLAPPWPHFWIEYRSRSGRQRRGVFVRDITSRLSASPDDIGPAAIDDARGNGYDGPIGWVVEFSLYAEDDRGRICGPMGWTTLALDDRGRVVGNRWALGIPDIKEERVRLEDILDSGGRLHPEESRDIRRMLDAIDSVKDDPQVAMTDERLLAGLLPAWQTVAFLHCRNVATEPVDVPEKLDKRHRKEHGRPLLRFQTVRLEVPRRSVASRDSRPGSGNGPPALHIVPGNFHHYGDCCPVSPSCILDHLSTPCGACGGHLPHGQLFGKLTGVYWVPSHARGNPTRGEVRSDFDLQVPAS